MISFPGCKINLGLHILYKREDGYHEIESVMYPVPLNDVLEIVPDNTFQFVSTGLAIPGNAEDNLCVRAYQLLQKDFQIPPVYMHLHKNIPLGGGLGGGSADGAHVLLLLNQLFQLGLSVEQLQHYAAQLGSDCPFFILNEPQEAKGRGELLAPLTIDLSDYFLKIINIGLHISTAEAYGNSTPAIPETSIRTQLTKPITAWKDALENDFEKGIFPRYPELKKIKDQLYAEGAVYASMSGSGSTMYGIFKEHPDYTMGRDCPTEVIVALR
jgi:4-diphosphocytidyl-2-C-methyl-D-erythritol kinase